MAMKKKVLIWTLAAALLCLPALGGAEGFTLPASLQTIEEEAFAGTAMENFEFPEALTDVGDQAFADISSLESVTIPPTDGLTISDTAFEGSDVLIRGEEGSYAETWADENGVPFIPVSERAPALVIGQTHYASSLTLPGSRNDAIAMRGMLTGLSNRFNTTLATDLTANQMRRAIRTVFSSAKETDVSLFYYSGHGFNDNGGTDQGALLGVDESRLTTRELASILSEVKGRVIVILDSCHSGAAITSKKAMKSGSNSDPLDAFLKEVISSFSGYTYSPDGIRKRSAELAVSKFTVIAAASFTEETGEATVDGYKCGLFTYGALKGLGCVYPNGVYNGSMPADNGDLRVTLIELYNYATGEVNKIYARYEATPPHAVYYGNDTEVLFRRD